MSYEHPKTTEFNARLDALFHDLDHFLEDEWGTVFSLHPNRPARGETSNPEMDGLFRAVPDFTAGYGSKKGRGYIITLKTSTLANIPPAQKEYLMMISANYIAKKLPQYFPERHLEVVKDGAAYKIIGDFSLGTV
ncbi:MAG: hypothetical protein LBM77_11795 [Spirochaetaceae bacterium]|jgi:hypothetical protein|nr:hypothetical protein [Spirochaetaceae bacterium]